MLISPNSSLALPAPLQPLSSPMVAEVSISSSKPRKRGSRKVSTAAWPLVRELAAQTLYLTDGLSPAQIAKSLATPADPITPQAVRSLIHRRGWSPQRRNTEAQAAILANARTREHVDRVVQATAAVAEAASVSGLQRALQSAQAGGEDSARDFRAWAGGARDLVNIVRLSRGLDKPDTLSGATTSASVFFVRCDVPQPQPCINVTPTLTAPQSQ